MKEIITIYFTSLSAQFTMFTGKTFGVGGGWGGGTVSLKGESHGNSKPVTVGGRIVDIFLPVCPPPPPHP